ncbi:energy transducer TonB [Ectopseudomonas mendocina]|uniref:Energy transducer TonB n=1 Tax=Ectopseudomonas mendocina TaxID=300 RepID=A0ABD7S060_ECTME|nr:energy transducer TonB [Pseudomonas mendocina]TRO14554.1 energy transducer TonB [Pseudomonas mendocina]TRO19605.1 energy transducer TonB [Pseudomonas mendocina]
MIPEQRRRAYLDAMQVASWLPRTVLPFAAPSRPELLEPPQAEVEVDAVEMPAEPSAPAVAAVREASVAAVVERPKIEIPRPGVQLRQAAVEPVAEPEQVEEKPARVSAPPPRFALQLLRAGDCALLVELPTGQPFQSRDPAYILLKDLLRAAGLPDSPQLLGEPVRWPLLVRGNMDQGPEAALEFVQSFVAARLEEQPSACLWLVGLPAIRFAGEADEHSYNRELQIEGLGACWALPGLELLMEEPMRKRELWQAMRRTRQRWSTPAQS